jgi:hypothetical protein
MAKRQAISNAVKDAIAKRIVFQSLHQPSFHYQGPKSLANFWGRRISGAIIGGPPTREIRIIHASETR